MKARIRTNNIFIETLCELAAQILLIFIVIAIWLFVTILAIFAICIAPFKNDQVFDILLEVLQKLEQIDYNSILKGR